jgi:hypothetical protein
MVVGLKRYQQMGNLHFVEKAGKGRTGGCEKIEK